MIGAVVIVVIAVSTVAAVVITAFLITRKKATGWSENTYIHMILTHMVQVGISYKFIVNEKDLRKACHTPSLKKAKKQGEMPLLSLGPIPSLNSTLLNGMGLRLGEGISPCFFASLRGGVSQAIPNPFFFLLNEFTGKKEMEFQKNVCYGEATAIPVCLDPVYDEVACIDMQI